MIKDAMVEIYDEHCEPCGKRHDDCPVIMYDQFCKTVHDVLYKLDWYCGLEYLDDDDDC